MKKNKSLLAWSGGISSAVTLFEVKSPEFKVLALIHQLSTLPKEIIDRQAESLEMSVIYSSREVPADLSVQKKKGLSHLVFGCQSIAENKSWALEMSTGAGLEPAFPLWNWSTKEKMRVFFSLGFKGIIWKINQKKMPHTFLGRPLDQKLMESFPAGIDLSGQNGEYDIFVSDGPFFQKPVTFKAGEKMENGDYLSLQIL